MPTKYLLDACALLSFLYKEVGADKVKDVLTQADIGNAEVSMNKINLFEAYYDMMRSKGFEQAEHFYEMVLKLPINVIDGIADPVFREAGRIKTQYRISLADSIVLGEASVMEAFVLTSDHHEFDMVEMNEDIVFSWIR